jgi:hypothetical protein
MNWRITILVALAAVSLAVADSALAQQTGKSKAVPRGTIMRMNAQGQMRAAPRTGESFPGCVRGGIGLGYSRGAAEQYCANKLGNRRAPDARLFV